MSFFESRKVNENDDFINLIRVACEDDGIRQLMLEILNLNVDKRNKVVHEIINDLKNNNAPNDFIEAFTYLLDRSIADKAREIILNH